MKYKIYDKWNDMDFGGTGVVGDLYLPKEQLVERFGEPLEVNGQYIEYRWLLKFEDGVPLIISHHKKDSPNHFCIHGFGKTNKDKQNLTMLKVKEMFDENTSKV